MNMTIVEATRSITGGVDTHLDVHVAAALDHVGGLLGVASFAVGPAGYEELLAWLESFGEVGKVGVERDRLVWNRARPVPKGARYRRHRGRPAKPRRATQIG